jgi:hypothetical protein
VEETMRIALLGLALLGAGCARGVRPDEMSAVGHRREAAAEEAEARRHHDLYDPKASVSRPGRGAQRGDSGVDGSTYNPTEWHRGEANAHLAHAQQHAAAAASLEGFEEAECRSLAAPTRAACPMLGRVEAIEDVKGGVRIRFAEEVPVSAVVQHMRCHLAYARARGFDKGADCPLYIRGERIEATPDARGVQILGADKAAEQEIRRRSREAAQAGSRPIGTL